MDYYKWSGLLRNYVRSNALCLTTSDFDARSRKIRHVAEPQFDSDAANKLYVERNNQIFRERQEIIEKRLSFIEQEMLTLHNEIHKTLQYVRHVEILSTTTATTDDGHSDVIEKRT